MMVVIFEVEMKPGKAERYFSVAKSLRQELEAIDGFLSVERFTSLATEGRYVSISFWRDRAAVEAWKANAAHREAQQIGKDEVFARYRIRVAEVFRDYAMP